VARYYVQRVAPLDRVERLVTVSSPPHAARGRGFLRNNKGARQMRPGSNFLKDLDEYRERLKRVRFTSIWNPLDLMIVPATSSVIAEARSVRVHVAAHPLIDAQPPCHAPGGRSSAGLSAKIHFPGIRI